MNTQRIEQVVSLTSSGWRPYNGSVAPSVYNALHCPHVMESEEPTSLSADTHSATGNTTPCTIASGSSSQEPCWFSRRDIFLCLGCDRSCSLNKPRGFQYRASPRQNILSGTYDLSPQELVKKKNLLRVDEVAYCLNVSERKVYDWVSLGRLIALKDKPLRIRADDVADMMHDFDD